MKTEKDKEQQCRWNYVRAVGNGMGEGSGVTICGLNCPETIVNGL